MKHTLKYFLVFALILCLTNRNKKSVPKTPQTEAAHEKMQQKIPQLSLSR
jgi:hypothetical protein